MFRNILAVLVFMSSVSAFAGAGDAGCGLGSMIFTKNAKLSQTLALTTNLSFYTQLFGITSGTSNCSASGFVMNDQEAKYYAEANLPNLKVDMARGQGESLTAFAQILGCQDSSVSSFGQLMQSKYDNIFPSENTSSDQVLSAVRLEMSRSNAVAQGCNKTI